MFLKTPMDGLSSLYMAMMKMMWNGYVDMLLQFYMVHVSVVMFLPVMFKSYHQISKEQKHKEKQKNRNIWCCKDKEGVSETKVKHVVKETCVE